MIISSEIVVAAITATGAVVASLVGMLYRKSRQAKVDSHAIAQAEKELNLKSATITPTDFLTMWDPVSGELADLFEETVLDSFVVFRAWNGLSVPRWTTAFYQVRKHGNPPTPYVHFGLDKPYVDTMHKMMDMGHVTVATEDMLDCGIKQLYISEGITHSLWFFIKRDQETKTSSAIKYCIFTTTEDKLDNSAEIKAQMIVNRLKELYGK